jgi:hypothetical protein
VISDTNFEVKALTNPSSVFSGASGSFPELASWRVIGSEEDAEEASSEVQSREWL